MKLANGRWVIGAALSAFLLIYAELATSATVGSAEKTAQIIVVRNVMVKDGAVSGELHNRSSRPLRDVELLIRYIWQWKNELKPGEDALGRAVYYTLEKEIPPGGAVSFTYHPSPRLPSRPDGYFETEVSIAGFTEIIP